LSIRGVCVAFLLVIIELRNKNKNMFRKTTRNNYAHGAGGNKKKTLKDAYI